MITLNKDRKQTKYGHMRREHMTHMTEYWHLKQELTLFQPNFNVEGWSYAGWGESIGSDMTIIK